MLVDLAVGILHTVFWFSVCIAVVFTIGKIAGKLSFYKGDK